MDTNLHLEAFLLFLTEQNITFNSVDIEESDYPGIYDNGTSFEFEGTMFHVLNDEERERATREILETFVEDFVMEQIPEGLRCYFDTDSFIEDAIMSDGYAHHLNSYGSEYEIHTDTGWFYVYPDGAF